MTIAANSSTSAASNQQTSTQITKNSQLDKDAFLKLLITQLKHQDPLSPVDNTQFMAQMAQFSSLEQLQNLNSSISQLVNLQAGNSGQGLMLFAINMLGKQVKATDPTTGQTYSGKVESYQIKDNDICFTVNGTTIPSSWVTQTSLADGGGSTNG